MILSSHYIAKSLAQGWMPAPCRRMFWVESDENNAMDYAEWTKGACVPINAGFLVIAGVEWSRPTIRKCEKAKAEHDRKMAAIFEKRANHDHAL